MQDNRGALCRTTKHRQLEGTQPLSKQALAAKNRRDSFPDVRSTKLDRLSVHGLSNAEAHSIVEVSPCSLPAKCCSCCGVSSLPVPTCRAVARTYIELIHEAFCLSWSLFEVF